VAETTSDIITKLEVLRARRQAIAGISSTSFSDQRTDFDGADLDKEIARLERRLVGNGTRLAGHRKGV
jgi:hypothetical protein